MTKKTKDFKVKSVEIEVINAKCNSLKDELE